MTFKHTEGPWSVGDTGDGKARIWADHRFLVASTKVSDLLRDEEQKANAQRIVACVNACEGIPTSELLDWANHLAVRTVLSSQRVQLLWALRTLLTAVDPSEPESFPGHHSAYLQSVAVPRAKAILEEVVKESA